MIGSVIRAEAISFIFGVVIVSKLIRQIFTGTIVLAGMGAILVGSASTAKAFILEEDFEFTYTRDEDGNVTGFEPNTFFDNGWFFKELSTPPSGSLSWFTSNGLFELDVERSYTIPNPTDPDKPTPVKGEQIFNESLQANTGKSWLAADPFGVAQTQYIPGQPWVPGTIKSRLISPLLELRNGAEISFFTRAATVNNLVPTPLQYADNLQVLLSKLDADLDPKEEDFEEPIFSLNPEQIPTEQGGYPTNWTQYKLKVNGLDQPRQGRIAFQYYVTDGGPGRPNGNLIGIDTFSYNTDPEAVPTPALLPGLLAIGWKTWRKRKQQAIA
jgi:hypothetical protein